MDLFNSNIIWIFLLLLIEWPKCLLMEHITTNQKIILNDLRKAFKIVMKDDSQLLDYMIEEMYGETMVSPNLTFLFKMPNEEKLGGYEILAMQRSDFFEPIFPNISLSCGRQFNVDCNIKRTEDIIDWNRLGLNGWVGELTPPIRLLEQNHRDVYKTDSNAYPHQEILLDIKDGYFNGHVKDVKVIKEDMLKAKEMTEPMFDNKNVYIARVNDPFGYSVEWQQTNNETQAAAAAAAAADDRKQRSKRGVVNLYSMIKCSSGCDPLVYKGYGCYCGIGGHGATADSIDRCCKIHDKCYEHSNCISYSEYFVPYIWKCYRGKPLCAIDHGEWGGPDSCAARLCQCDLRLSRCLARYQCPLRRAVCRSSRVRQLQNLIYFN